MTQKLTLLLVASEAEESSSESSGILIWSLSKGDLQYGDPFEVKLIEPSNLSFIARRRYKYHGLELFRGSAEDVSITDSQKDLILIDFSNGSESLVRSPLFCPKGKRAYFEVTFERIGDNPKVGVCSENLEAALGQFFDFSDVQGDIWVNSKENAYFEDRVENADQVSSNWENGSVVGIMCDLLHGTVVAFHNGIFQHMFLTETLTSVDKLFPVFICDSSRMLVNFGQLPFSHPHLSFLPIQSFVDCFFDQSLSKKSSKSIVYNKWDKIDARKSTDNDKWFKAVVLNHDISKGALVHFIGFGKEDDDVICPEDIHFRIRARRNYTQIGPENESLQKLKLLYNEKMGANVVSGGFGNANDSRSNVSQGAKKPTFFSVSASDSDDDDGVYDYDHRVSDVDFGYVADYHHDDEDDEGHATPSVFPMLSRLISCEATRSHDDTTIHEYKRPGVVLCRNNHSCEPTTYENYEHLCTMCASYIEEQGFSCSKCDFDICCKCARKRRALFDGLVKCPDDDVEYTCRLKVFEESWQKCNLCCENIIQGSQGLQCAECDFYVCHNCTSMPSLVCFEEYSTVRSQQAFKRQDRIGFFEIKIDSLYLLQLGFVTGSFKSDLTIDTRGIGVGDDKNGWGWDGSRNCLWTNGEFEELPAIDWSEGDVLGFLCDFNRNTTSLFQNGELKHSKMFSETISELYPAFTGQSSKIRVYWRNGFEFCFSKEMAYPYCIMCDNRHTCQPCVYDQEEVCSLCGTTILSETYGIRCQPCGFFCCSCCDVKSSVFYHANAGKNASEGVFESSTDDSKSLSTDFQVALHIKENWTKLGKVVTMNIAGVNDWMKSTSMHCEHCKTKSCYPHYFKNQGSESDVCEKCQHRISGYGVAEIGSKCEQCGKFKLCHKCTFSVPFLNYFSKSRWLYSVFTNQGSFDDSLSGYFVHYHQPFELQREMELKDFEDLESFRINVEGKVVHEKDDFTLSFRELNSGNDDSYTVTIPGPLDATSADSHWIKGKLIPSNGILGFPRKTCQFNHVCEIYVCDFDDFEKEWVCDECDRKIELDERGLCCRHCKFYLCFEHSSCAEPLEGIDDCRIDQCHWNSSDFLVAGVNSGTFADETTVRNGIRIWNITDGVATICQSTNTDEKRLIDVKMSELQNKVLPWKYENDGTPQISVETNASKTFVTFSEFSTVRGELSFKKKEIDIGFYEVTIVKIGPCPQIGFCLETFEHDHENNSIGAGDDDLSWGFDGKRNKIWCDDPRSVPDLRWKDGDVIGLMCDFSTRKITVFTNGELCDESVDISKDVVQLFPCITGRSMKVR
jgi:hypothetical protein